MTLHAALDGGLVALGVELDERSRTRLVDYVRLVEKWNRVYNLTAVRNVEDMVTQHVLDSLAAMPHLPGRSLLDVGSGAGLPGIPIAIAQPARAVTLLDASHKKAAFLRQAAIELELSNVEVVCERVEAWQPGRTYDVVISRAFAELREFVALTARFCAPEGMLAAMKGVYPDEELGALPAGYTVIGVPRLRVPGLAADRHLVLIQPATAVAASARI